MFVSGQLLVCTSENIKGFLSSKFHPIPSSICSFKKQHIHVISTFMLNEYAKQSASSGSSVQVPKRLSVQVLKFPLE